MIGYTTYKFIHLVGILFIFIAIGGLSALAQGSKPRKIYGMLHGIFLLITFVAGFGLIARLNLPTPWPMWIWCKLAGWLVIGMAPKFTKSWSPIQTILFYGVFGAVMAYLALYKPF